MATSNNGTTFKTSKAIIDNHGQAWTISPDANAWVLLDGKRAGGSYDAAMLLWYNNVLYHQNTGGDFYGWDNTQKAWYYVAQDPRVDPRLAVLNKMFYGINAHWDFPNNPPALIALMKDIGLTSLRMTWESSDQSLGAIANWAQALQGSGIQMVVCVNAAFKDVSGNYWASETAAYNYAKAAAAKVALTLAPFGVHVYELGNEYTRAAEIITNDQLMGSNLSDFKQDYWPQMRGLIRGIHDGVKSADSKALTAAVFCVGDIAASDALWHGKEPGGATGKPQVRWDITSWHNYEVYGSVFNMAPDGDGSSGRYDLVDYCDKAYGVPFMISEWGSVPEKSDADQAAYYTQALTSFYANRKRGHGIKAVMSYQMLGNPWGITSDDYAKNASARYAALKAFIAANPDN